MLEFVVVVVADERLQSQTVVRLYSFHRSFEMLALQEANAETLECARYGEDDDLRALFTTHGADPNYGDDNGTMAMHRAAANGQVGCLQVLKEFGSLHKPNMQGNLPIHWAALNGQAESLKYLIDNYDVDMLIKNDAGRSTLTEAFQSQKTEVIEICLSHPSASEENLMKTDDPDVKVSIEGDDDNDYDEKHAVVHLMDFSSSLPNNDSPRLQLKIRELPITRADNPFGSDTAPEDDTTGLGIWSASVLLARWAVRERELIRGKTVIELGAGCGLPSLAAAVYCSPSSVYLTDIHDPTLKNSAYNARLNGTSTAASTSASTTATATASASAFIEQVTVDVAPTPSVTDAVGKLSIQGETVFRKPSDGTSSAKLYVSKVSWSESETFPSEKADVLLGSDLVYDSKILTLLTKAVDGMLAPDGVFLYIAPDECRDGIDGLLGALASVGLQCVMQQPCEEWMYENPLAEESNDGDTSMDIEGAMKKGLVDRGDNFVLHFYDLAAKKQHSMYKFVRKS